MIVTLTPNPALDVTYAVRSVALGGSHRVTDVRARAGGKGVNTASVLTAMGCPCVAVAPVGGASRAAYAADLRRRGVRADLVDSPVDVRRSVAVVEADGRATLFNEAGAAQPLAVWGRVVDAVRALMSTASVLAISGSLPEGVDPDFVPDLTREAVSRGVQVILDVAGDSLTRSLAARPALVKPNLSEAAATLVGAGRGHLGAADAARMLVEAGAGAAIVSQGAKGLTALTRDSALLHASLPQPLRGNPTGAGDALTAALAAELDARGGLPTRRDELASVLSRAVAWSAAAVLQPVAGMLDPADVDRLRPSVEIKEITA